MHGFSSFSKFHYFLNGVIINRSTSYKKIINIAQRRNISHRQLPKSFNRINAIGTGSSLLAIALFTSRAKETKKNDEIINEVENIALEQLPVVEAELTSAPMVPAPLLRDHPVRLVAKLDTDVSTIQLTRERQYRAWNFNGTVPGPFIRAREGDVLEVQFTNRDQDGIAHNIDFHAVIGPGGGAPLLFAEKDQTRVARFRLLYPGLYMYHCAAAPIPMHIANGMYGLLLVEPAKKSTAILPRVDKEFYVMQSEFYTAPSLDQPKLLEYSYSDGLEERANTVVFNGREGALTDRPLMAKTGERVRIYFGNAGPNLASAFHVIGTVFDHVYRDGGLIDPPAHGLSTLFVPPGGATIVEIDAMVPGTYTLLDHAIHRIDKGAVGYLKVSGADRDDIYAGDSVPTPCPDCKLHE